jgi:hypothetical protein
VNRQIVAAFGRPSDLRQAKEAFAIRDARSAISNRLAGPLPVFQNGTVVENYLRLFGNRIDTWDVCLRGFWVTRASRVPVFASRRNRLVFKLVARGASELPKKSSRSQGRARQ